MNLQSPESLMYFEILVRIRDAQGNYVSGDFHSRFRAL